MFVNFEYEVHVVENGNPYIRGFLESITDKPKYQVFDLDLDAYDAVLVYGDTKKTMEKAEEIGGYTMKYEHFTTKEEN